MPGCGTAWLQPPGWRWHTAPRRPKAFFPGAPRSPLLPLAAIHLQSPLPQKGYFFDQTLFPKNLWYLSCPPPHNGPFPVSPLVGKRPPYPVWRAASWPAHLWHQIALPIWRHPPALRSETSDMRHPPGSHAATGSIHWSPRYAAVCARWYPQAVNVRTPKMPPLYHPGRSSGSFP